MALQAPCPREAISVDLKGGGQVAMFHESDTQFGLLPFVYRGGLRGLPYGHGRPGPDVARETAAVRRSHAHGNAGFATRTHAAADGAELTDAYLHVLDRCLADGVLDENDIAILRETATATAWNLSMARLDEVHRFYLDALPGAVSQTSADVLEDRLRLIESN